MADHGLTAGRYVMICIVLVLLTLLTVSVSFVELPGGWHIAAGLTIGLVKASLVVMFFMHALYSERLTGAVIAVACFWLGLLLVLTLCDYLTRDMIPYMPGH